MDSGSSVGSFYGVWLLAFLIIKVGGTALATWSWLWVLLPIVPDLVLLFRKLGWL